MLDDATIQILAGGLVVLALAGAAVLGRSVLGPRGRVVASRTVRRGSEAAWLGTTALAQGWILGVAVLPAWFYAQPSFGELPAASILQGLGLVLWLAGMGIAGWSARVLGRSLTVSLQVTEGQRLVEEGPYARVRHPIYTANVAAALGLSLLFLSPPLLVLTAALAVLAVYRGQLEDAFLRSPEAFGARYDAYLARTGRFFPRIRRRP